MPPNVLSLDEDNLFDEIDFSSKNELVDCYLRESELAHFLVPPDET